MNTRTLVEQPSLKVTGADAFPKDLACEVHIGSKLFPYFTTEGRDERVTTAMIEVDLGSSVSIVRKETKENSFVLCFFSEDTDGKVLALYDLNFDGQWDVKKTPTREQQNFIFIDGEWVDVDSIEGILSSVPSAKGEGQFEFRTKWQTVNCK